jgi:acyl-CoA synthetase (AMP-forming)/AMP-acid ligase II
VGRVLGNTQAKIVDVETGKSLPIGERGEVHKLLDILIIKICVRGPQIMLGYWKNQQGNHY